VVFLSFSGIKQMLAIHHSQPVFVFFLTNSGLGHKNTFSVTHAKDSCEQQAQMSPNFKELF
jgi:hypothetical protein